jgi:hypothetical protein
MPIDPGEHRVEVRAPGFVPWSAVVRIPSGEHRELVVGPLLAETAPARPPPPIEAPVRALPTSNEPATPRYRLPAFVLGATGLAGIGAGAIAGIIAIQKNSDSESLCEPRCNRTGYSLNGDAKTAADVATVSFAIGAAALATGIILYLVGRPTSPFRF